MNTPTAFQSHFTLRAMFIVFMCCLMGSARAQEFIDNDVKVLPYDLFWGGKDYQWMRRELKNITCDGGTCSNGRKYAKIAYTIGNTAFYTPKAKYDYKNDFRKKGVYYTVTDKLYYKPSLKLYDYKNDHVYHEDGTFYNGEVDDDNDPGLTRWLEIDKNGLVLCDKPAHRPRYKAQKSDTYGAMKPTHQVKTPNTYLRADGFRVYGYDHVAVVANDLNYAIYTGFTAPLTKYLSNATVLYKEDKVTNKNYWVVLLDREEKFSIETTDAAPYLETLRQNTTFEQFELDGEIPFRFTKKYSRYLLQYHDSHLIKCVTKDDTNLNGYGIRYYTTDEETVADGVFLEIGLFKNGKLDGIGLRSKLIRPFRAAHDFTPAVLYRDDKGAIAHEIAYGIFKDGVPTKTSRSINIKDKNPGNYWDYIPIAGFIKKMGAPAGHIIPNKTTDFNNLKSGDHIYIEEIGRTTRVHTIDKQKRLFTVNTDNKDIKARFDASYLKNLYVQETDYYTLKETCVTTVKEPILRKAKKYLYTRPATIKRNTYTVKGVYYDKIVTNTVTTPGEDVYEYYDEVVGYNTYPCSKCNGTGSITRKTTDVKWIKITF